MTYCSAKLLPYAITGLSTLIGRVLTIDEWADAAQIPERSGMGVMSGALGRSEPDHLGGTRRVAVCQP